MTGPAPAKPFRLTIIHLCVGRFVGMKRYIRTWKMEPIPAAMIAALTPADVEKRFYDDRLEEIPYDEPTDLVAISVETYTAKRAYQIASEYRLRGVPVVIGGFHATLWLCARISLSFRRLDPVSAQNHNHTSTWRTNLTSAESTT